MSAVDVVIIGAGPGGSCLATYLAESGRSVVVIEKETFPRFHIGESLTGVAGAVLKELGLIEALDEHEFPAKGGVKVIGQGADVEFFVPVLEKTYQVRRAEFDTLLVERAKKAGVEFRKGKVLSVIQEGDKVVGVRYEESEGAEPIELRCRYVADASGSAIVLSRLGIAGKRVLNPRFDKQIALFTHIEGAVRDPGQMGDNTFIFYDKLHHWAWFIPVSPTVTSVGVVMPNSVFKPLGGKDEAMKWGLDNINPDLSQRVQGKDWKEPVRAATNYAYTVEPFAGNGWLCLGDAHGFIDPIFSFGVSIAIQEAREACRRINAVFEGAAWQEEMDTYAKYCRRGFAVAEDLINYFWEFPVFFGYLMRGSLRRDIIRLLGSDIHTEDELPAIATMRRALRREQKRKSAEGNVGEKMQTRKTMKPAATAAAPA